MHRPCLLALACAAALAASPASAAVRPVVADLGTYKLPLSISGNGGVVVGIDVTEGRRGTFRWSGAGLQRLGDFDAGRPAVSRSGDVVGATVLHDGVAQAAFWTAAGGWKRLDETDLIPALPGWSTETDAISANGRRLAGGTTPPPLDYNWVRGFSFNPDNTEFDDDYGWAELPLERKASVAWASGISDDGRIQVGSNNDAVTAFRAVRWRDGRIERLLDADGQWLGGESVSCNADCNVIVGGGGGVSAVKPVLAWRLRADSGMPACYFKALDGPKLPALRYYAYATSEDGGVVVGAYFYDQVIGNFVYNLSRAFIWIADASGGTTYDLSDYLSQLGQPLLVRAPNSVANAVSSDGRYLAGWHEDPTGVMHGWRVDLLHPARAIPTAAANHVTCPTASARATRTARAQAGTAYPQPTGEFRAPDGRRYVVRARGATLYAGNDPRRLAPLVWLGGDRYYDPASGLHRDVVRDARGEVVGLRSGAGRQRCAPWPRIGG